MKFYSLNQLPLYTNDFFIRWLDDIQARDTIVVFNPMDAEIVTPVLLRSRKSLKEHIDYIQEKHIKKAIVVAEDIAFIRECPELEYLWILPAISAKNFDFSPIYDLPNLKWLQCETMYGLGAMYENTEKVKISSVDYQHFPKLKKLQIKGAKGHENVHAANSVESLLLSFGFPSAKTLSGFLPGASLKSLDLSQSPVESLDGIEIAGQLQRLELAYNRRLTDISALRTVKDTLAYLSIEKCGKITDFSVLRELSNLQFLTLKGSNVLKDLSFLEGLPKLRNFHLTMNVEDGDLGRCCSIPFVKVQNRKHYTHKDIDFAKDFTNPDDVLPIDID